MLKKIVNIFTVMFVVLGMLAATSPAFAHSNQGKVKGIIAAVDTTASTVTITPKNGGADVTVNVDASTRIKHNGQPAALADLQLGDKAEAKYDLTTLLASKIEAKLNLSELKGTIAAVDTTASAVTITPKNGGADVTVTADASTLIKRYGVAATLADLMVGDKVEAKYNAATMLAAKIEVKMPELKGAISAVDAVAGTLTVTPKNGGADMTFSVDASTFIKLNHAPATLADLLVGDRVEVKYDSATLLAFKIEAKR